MPFANVLVAAAAAGGDEPLLAYAARLAERGVGRSFGVVHVVPAGAADEEAARRLRIVEAAIVRSGLGRHGRASGAVPAGDLLDTLLREAAVRRADLVLVGHGGAGRRSLARRLAMTAPCSVWMVPAGSPVAPGRILAPVDFSRGSAHGLEVATAVAAKFGLSRVDTLHVRFNPAATTFEDYDRALLVDAQQAFRIFMARTETHGVDLAALFEEGADVAAAILDVARRRDDDLVVMSTRGRSRAAAVLLGSETDHVMMRSPVPVLAVKRHGARLGLLQALLDPRVRDRSGPPFT